VNELLTPWHMVNHEMLWRTFLAGYFETWEPASSQPVSPPAIPVR
jgi:hypothetical protein